MVDAGVDMFVIRGTTVVAEHVSSQAEPLNLKEFIYELDVPVIVGGCATHQAALHLMRTGAAGVLVGFGGGAAHTTRTVLGVAVPMASAVADVAAARRDYLDESGGRYVHVIADGSIGKSGDIAKAIACGADAVMVGSPFARATDAPGRGFHWGAEAHHADLPRGERVEFEQVGTLRGDPVRPLPRRRRHHEPDRRAQPLDGHDRLHRAQGVPAGRGRRRVGPGGTPGSGFVTGWSPERMRVMEPEQAAREERADNGAQSPEGAAAGSFSAHRISPNSSAVRPRGGGERDRRGAAAPRRGAAAPRRGAGRRRPRPVATRPGGSPSPRARHRRSSPTPSEQACPAAAFGRDRARPCCSRRHGARRPGSRIAADHERATAQQASRGDPATGRDHGSGAARQLPASRWRQRDSDARRRAEDALSQVAHDRP